MFDYEVDGLPSGKPSVWSHLSLHPLAPGTLTPFSFSVLSEVLGRTWYVTYDRLGFDPRPGAEVLRQYNGRPYLNLTLSATLESTRAGIPPMTLRVNGQDYPIAPWEKPSLLNGMRTGRAQRKMADEFDRLAADVEQTTDMARSWYLKTRETVWGQAELLQVMEQIERISLKSAETFFVARHNLEWAYNRLIRLTEGVEPFPANLSLINNALRDVDDLVENEMATEMLAMAALAEKSPDVLAWLKTDRFGEWQTDLPDRDVRTALDAFLSTYGHRSADEGEMSHPRWRENPTPVLKGILACAKPSAKHASKMPSTQSVDRLMAAVSADKKKEASKIVDRMRQALRLQSKALNAVAYILAGTRCWALAAAAEAMGDGRLSDISDVFYFELEEIKQMMTGEWNIANVDQIRATGEERRIAYAQWQQMRVPDLLIDDLPAKATVDGLPGSAGRVTAPLRRWDTLQPHVCNGAVVGVEQLSSGWSIVLPVAQAIITATGTPFDPVVAAARLWHTPIVLALGATYDGLVEGAQTTVDADQMIVDQ